MWSGSRGLIQTTGWHFLTSSDWDPVNDSYGALPFIFGTLVSSILALIIAVPLGVGGAVFLSELAPPTLSSSLTFVSDLLAAVPSVIYGLLGEECRWLSEDQRRDVQSRYQCAVNG